MPPLSLVRIGMARSESGARTNCVPQPASAAPSVSGRCNKAGQNRNPFLALSRDVGTVRVHRASDALRRYKSGTGLASGITSAAPGIILVIAALSLIHCQTFGGNDNEQEDCGGSAA